MVTDDLKAALSNGIPAEVITCSSDGIPNATVISQVYFVDDHRVALSYQFFNKTVQNVRTNPRVCAAVNDPMRARTYLLDLEFSHSETEGPVFDEMDMQIEAIASATGMAGVFKLKAADIYRVRAVDTLQF
jgi:hypothetical protein